MDNQITFDPGLVLPGALEYMAERAEIERDRYEHTSASHYSAWHALATALRREVQRRFVREG